MKVTLLFVPPGGGETDYGLDFELPGVPQRGDYICVAEPGEPGRRRDFIVRRTWWILKPGEPAERPGVTDGVTVECEFSLSPYSSESHKRAAESYRARKGKLTEFDESCY